MSLNTTEYDSGIYYHGDCLEVMKEIPDKSIDMILCDLPYGTTACKWDVIIPVEPLWDLYKRIIKNNGAIVLFGIEPFSSLIRMSCLDLYKYDIIWDKIKLSNFQTINYQPGRIHENISIFSKGKTSFNKTKQKMNYFPQMTKYDVPRKVNKTNYGTNYVTLRSQNDIKELGPREYKEKYPKSIVTFSGANVTGRLHPTQKPVALFEYLIKTYTNENDLVLDNCSGSGTTAIACINTNRKWICIEKDEDYYNKSIERINETIQNSDKL